MLQLVFSAFQTTGFDDAGAGPAFENLDHQISGLMMVLLFPTPLFLLYGSMHEEESRGAEMCDELLDVLDREPEPADTQSTQPAEMQAERATHHAEKQRLLAVIQRLRRDQRSHKWRLDPEDLLAGRIDHSGRL